MTICNGIEALCDLYLSGRVCESTLSSITRPLKDLPLEQREARAAEIMALVDSCKTEAEMIEKVQSAQWK